MQIRFLLGPAGSGKTYRCLAEVREALTATPQGPPSLFIAPKQATYQLERQLLAEPSLQGYTRLRIFSFERLAHFVFQQAGRPLPQMLDEQGRVMVLRGLLSRKVAQLKLFRASARLTGFAQELSQVLSELQRDQLSPETLRDLARRVVQPEPLVLKLEDLAALLQDYLDWLKAHQLQDVDTLLTSAAAVLRGDQSAFITPKNEPTLVNQRDAFHLEKEPALRDSYSLWLDGFAEFSRQELDLLAALMPSCHRATVAFCLDRAPSPKFSWLSSWSVIQRTFEACRDRLATIPGAELITETLPRQPEKNRFADNPILDHLEHFWAEPQPYLAPQAKIQNPKSKIEDCLRLAVCVDPEGEAVLAAREILRHVRAGGRYRETAVLVRKLEGYQQVLQRVFARYEIPCFLDRRESVAHHPLAELTRSALRTVAFGWQREDWFAALKTGLAPAVEEEIDRLENEALARGWQGSIWLKPLVLPGGPEQNRWLADLQHRVVPPFHRLALSIDRQPTGPQLGKALRKFWSELGAEERLEQWAGAELSNDELRRPASVHATVWEQMNAWLDNLERAFPVERLPLREWLPILEAGLSGLSVGVIPPALDQVLIGAIDRSRNPDLKLVLVLGLNEGVFPARPRGAPLLTDADRLVLEKHGALLGTGARHQLGRERFFAYIACSRARDGLVLCCSQRSAQGAPLNPSPFFARVQELFPEMPVETVSQCVALENAEHVSEIIAPLLTSGKGAPLALRSLPPVAEVFDSLSRFQEPGHAADVLSPEWSTRLYGPAIRTSVSRLEQFAACPFKFFVHSGLRAEERKLFELDRKEQGSFQHEVLALFHQQLHEEAKRWRDLTPKEARERIGAIARSLVAGYRDGLLQASDQTRFLASSLTESLQDFVATLVDWMRNQYRFDPVAVELPYGGDDSAPAWTIDLGHGRSLELHGRIDRVDLSPMPGADEALCVVVDYKSSRKQLDPVLLAHGLQLQLLAYLNVLRHWPEPRRLFGVQRLIPVGVFYVNLRGRPPREANRRAALADPEQARKLACRHSGRFDLRALRLLDARPDAQQGDQFNYRLTQDGQISRNSSEAMATADFLALLDSVEANLKHMGRRIFAGDTEVSPFRKGAQIACDQCEYQAICRIDPWTHRYRVLRLPEPDRTAPSPTVIRVESQLTLL